MRLRCCNKNQECIDFFAQYGTSSNPASGSFIPLNAIFRRGDEIHLEEETQIVLAPGYLYLIDYVFLATGRWLYGDHTIYQWHAKASLFLLRANGGGEEYVRFRRIYDE